MEKETPTLNEILKLYSKKELWDRIQEKNTRIEELGNQIKDLNLQLNQQLLESVDNDSYYETINEYEKRISELEDNIKNASRNNYLSDYYLAEKKNQQLKIENENLKVKISTQLQNNVDNVDFMENQRREIKQLREDLQAKNILVNTYMSIVGTLDNARKIQQSQNKKAIEMLEKIKSYFTEEYIDEDGTPTGDWTITKDSADVAEYIDSQLEELRGE